MAAVTTTAGTEPRKKVRTSPRTTPQQKVGWGIGNFVVVALALIPVLWMVSLSFKTPAAILDPSFIPKSWT